MTLKLDLGRGYGEDCKCSRLPTAGEGVGAGPNPQGKPGAHSSEREGRTFLREGACSSLAEPCPPRKGKVKEIAKVGAGAGSRLTATAAQPEKVSRPESGRKRVEAPVLSCVPECSSASGFCFSLILLSSLITQILSVLPISDSSFQRRLLA